ncbi:MAG: 3-hydroxyacyl-ACP dehydratase FabZ [bacterium]
MLDIQDILKVLPHRYPLLLVDKVIELGENKIVAIKNVTFNEPFFQGHFPGTPIMPGVLIIEAMAQAGAILYIKTSGIDESKEKLIYFMGIDKAKFRRPVIPGDQLRIEVEFMRKHSRASKLCAKAFVENKIVAEGELLASIQVKEIL